MVETIAPVVYGNRTAYRIAVAIHTIAATATAAVFGAVLGLAGMAFGAPWEGAGALAVVIAAAAYAARELAGIPVPLFDRKRQVPDWWRTFYSPRVSAALYGAGLGVGFATLLRHGTFVVVVVVAVTSGDPALAAMAVAPFGLARGLSVLAGSGSPTADDSGLTVARLEEVATGPWPRIANGVACVALGAIGATGL